MAQQQEQLDQCNEQLPGREHAMDNEDCMMPNGVVAGSAGDIVSESWKQHLQQHCHRLQEALFRAAALAIHFETMIHPGRVQKMDGPRFWMRRSSVNGPTLPERHHQSCMPQSQPSCTVAVISFRSVGHLTISVHISQVKGHLRVHTTHDTSST